MRVLGISASPRRDGNSEILLDKALEGAQSKGAKTEKIIIADLNISPCDGNNRCWKSGRCYKKDDMQMVYKKIESANLVFISSPVYFGSVTAQLKTLIDRSQSAWVKNCILSKPKTRCSRKGLFISVSGHENRKFFRNQKEILKIFFMVLNIVFAKSLYIPAIDSKGDVLKNSSALKRAYSAGSSLI